MGRAYLSTGKQLKGSHITNMGMLVGSLPLESGTHDGEVYFNKIARAARELHPDSIGIHSVRVLFNPSAKNEPIQFHAVPFKLEV